MRSPGFPATRPFHSRSPRRPGEIAAQCQLVIALLDKELFDLDLQLEDEDEYDTLGGLIYHRIGGVPKPGDQVQVNGGTTYGPWTPTGDGTPRASR